MDRPKLIFISGPTAAGKTQLAHTLAREVGADIINADSMQIYRYMDIGTAKPTSRERKEVPYHLIDILDPDEDFDASSFRKQALAVIAELQQRRRPMFFVGGTGLYLRVLQRGIFPCPPADPLIRERLRKTAKEKGPEFLWAGLQVSDPESARRIKPKDTFRLVRALEVLEMTGRPISDWQHWKNEPPSAFDILWIGITREREALYRRINERTEAMMAAGFLGEVRGLLEKGFSPQLKSMQSLGYRHLVEVLKGERELSAAVELIKRDTRRYAKRQMTWLRKEDNLHWFSPEKFDTIQKLIGNFYR
ncbi:MAG: tRNA (adenosine(37)-N6)-dimethylallyltransferase MiaA [Thermodesulfobacteriota bacterium]